LELDREAPNLQHLADSEVGFSPVSGRNASESSSAPAGVVALAISFILPLRAAWAVVIVLRRRELDRRNRLALARLGPRSGTQKSRT